MLIKGRIIIFGIVCYLTSANTSTTQKPLASLEEPLHRLEKAHAICAQEKSATPSDESNGNEQITPTFIRCIVMKMGLWTDYAGYNAKRVAKFFKKKHQENEVMTVVDYCNRQHQQTNRNLWAYEAYRCATAGTMGTWVKEYMRKVKL